MGIKNMIIDDKGCQIGNFMEGFLMGTLKGDSFSIIFDNELTTSFHRTGKILYHGFWNCRPFHDFQDIVSGGIFLARRLVCFRSLFGQSGFHRKNSVLLIAQNSPYAKIFALSLIWDVPAKFLYANSSQYSERVRK
uniref:Uncharacterized protein n=1 Tax=Rhizophagus irregularis (strain DAOM 181602 / DAOM 197198 / MUCL 43194) TaxID=747089 RepID=U9TCV5_RHIID